MPTPRTDTETLSMYTHTSRNCINLPFLDTNAQKYIHSNFHIHIYVGDCDVIATDIWNYSTLHHVCAMMGLTAY